jgi:hypothetical protein
VHEGIGNIKDDIHNIKNQDPFKLAQNIPGLN